MSSTLLLLLAFCDGGGGGFGGGGFNVTMVIALAGWTVVEGLVMRVVKKFDRI